MAVRSKATTFLYIPARKARCPIWTEPPFRSWEPFNSDSKTSASKNLFYRFIQ